MTKVNIKNTIRRDLQDASETDGGKFIESDSLSIKIDFSEPQMVSKSSLDTIQVEI